MSGNAAPVTVHAGLFVQSRLPVVLHRVIPTGTLSLQNIGTLEAALIANLLYVYVMRRPSSVPLDTVSEILFPMAVGAGVYKMLPP
jgi:hypothetical protein